MNTRQDFNKYTRLLDLLGAPRRHYVLSTKEHFDLLVKTIKPSDKLPIEIEYIGQIGLGKIEVNGYEFIYIDISKIED